MRSPIVKSPRSSATFRRLRAVRPFSSCTDEELAVVAGNTWDHRAPAGYLLTEEGRLAREWIVIVDGTAVVRVGDEEVARLGPGDVIGEVALLDRGVRTASVVAETPMDTLVASTAEFDRILVHAPSVARQLLIDLARRLRATDDRLVPRGLRELAAS